MLSLKLLLTRNTVSHGPWKLRPCASYMSVNASAKADENLKIVIPKRINRSSTAVLEALAKTVSRDLTAPHYKFHDDPFLIPASNPAKRSYALSKESGRKAAKWIFANYPNLFEITHAEPKLQSFFPIPKYDEKSDLNEASLRDSIERRWVSTSNTVYHLLLKKGVKISTELRQSLLELLCFYNGEDPSPDDNLEEKWYRQNSSNDKRQRKTWNDGGITEEIFNSMESKTPEAYCSMIRGMAKYFQVDRAYALYQEMQDKQMFTDVYTYNALIPLATYVKDSFELRWQSCEQLMTNMSREGVVPNLGTFNSVLEVLSKISHWRNSKKLSLETIGEMKEFGIEPSLASYNYLLNVFYKDKGPLSTILYDIMEEIDGKEFNIRDSRDLHFFSTAMQICHLHIMDKDMALKVHKLLNTGNNFIFIGDSMKESSYYQHLIKLLCFTDSLDNFFKFYSDHVPSVYTPEPSVMFEILNAVEMNSGWKYIPQMWTDIVLFEQWPREMLLQKLLFLLAENKPEGELLQQFADIACDIKEKIDSQKTDRLRNVVSWTGVMIGNVLQTFLNAGRFDNAWEMLNKCQDEGPNIVGFIDGKVLYNFLIACAENNDIKKAMFCLRYISDAGLSDAKYAELVLKKFQLSEYERSKVQHLMGSQADDKPEQQKPEHNN